jgi:hypothetical protein
MVFTIPKGWYQSLSICHGSYDLTNLGPWNLCWRRFQCNSLIRVWHCINCVQVHEVITTTSYVTFASSFESNFTLWWIVYTRNNSCHRKQKCPWTNVVFCIFQIIFFSPPIDNRAQQKVRVWSTLASYQERIEPASCSYPCFSGCSLGTRLGRPYSALNWGLSVVRLVHNTFGL